MAEAEHTQRLRVLVVDDEPGIVDVVSMALRHHGFDVAAVQTGAGGSGGGSSSD